MSWENLNEIRTDSVLIEIGTGLTLTKSRDNRQPKSKYTIESVPVANCPLPMTRAALIALRASSGLSKDCDYVITDHVQNRLIAGTTIHLQAIDSNTISELVSVKTTYDNEAWAGLYNIDTGFITELKDNIGNIVRGVSGNEVANFDWGNTAYTNCIVDNSTWTVTFGTALTRSNIKIIGGSTFITTTSGGTISNVLVENGASVSNTGNTSLINCRFSGVVTVTNPATAVTNWSNLELKSANGATILASTAGSNITINGFFITSSIVGLTGTGVINIINSKVEYSTLNKTNVGGAFTLSGSEISLSTIDHTGGTASNVTLTNTKVISGSSITKATGLVAGSTTFTNSIIHSSSLSVGRVTSTFSRTEIKNNCIFSYLSTNGLTINITDSIFTNVVNFSSSATATAGTITIDRSNFQNSFTFTVSCPFSAIIQECSFSNQSSLLINNAGGNVSMNLFRVNLSNTSIIQNQKTVNATSIINGSNITNNSSVVISGTGGFNIGLTNSIINSASSISCTGTTSNINISGITMNNNSFIDINNYNAPNNLVATQFSIDRCSLDNSSNITSTVAVVPATSRGIQRVNLSSFSSIIIPSSTVNILIQRSNLKSSSILTTSATCSSIDNLTMDGGALNQSAGTVLNLHIANLTTINSAFNIARSYYLSSVNFTTTAINNDKGRDFFNNNWI